MMKSELALERHKKRASRHPVVNTLAPEEPSHDHAGDGYHGHWPADPHQRLTPGTPEYMYKGAFELHRLRGESAPRVLSSAVSRTHEPHINETKPC